MDRKAKLRQLEALHAEVRKLEADLAVEEAPDPWQPSGYYLAYYATTGFLLGFLAASTSLLFNIIGSVTWPSLGGTPQHPLRLIQVYLTFPLGEAALSIDTGIVLAIGCCLYLLTGAVYGVLFQLAFTWVMPASTLYRRLIFSSVLALVLWLFNFYAILLWLQPWLFGGSWIIDLVPPWVAATTHLVFGWTMALLYPLGLYHPYSLQAKHS